MKRSNETVAFPRTASAAFQDADYACAVERRRPQERIWLWLVSAAGVVGLVLAFFQEVPR